MTLTEKLLQQDKRLTPTLKIARRANLQQRRRILSEMFIRRNENRIVATIKGHIDRLTARINALNCEIVVDCHPKTK